jgi:ABC-type polysaccharide/polyol phosphate export permease
MSILARSEFHVRYKRASLGIVWAVAVPLLQAAVLVVVFSKVIRVSSGSNYGLYVLAGVMAWGYFNLTITSGSTSIVDGSELTAKVWFPRALLPIVPVLSGLPGLAVSLLAVIVGSPILGGGLGPRLLWLVPASALLILFTGALSLALAALHVYFRDVKFLTQAALLVLFYATPIVYPMSFVGGLRPYIVANPMTGIIDLFHLAAVGHLTAGWVSVLISIAWSVVLTIVAVEAYRHHDRLFVDRL